MDERQARRMIELLESIDAKLSDITVRLDWIDTNTGNTANNTG